jgi:hypothetical protein
MYVSLRLFFFVILLCPWCIKAQQDFKIDNNFLLFEETETGLPVLMYNDSMLVKGFDFKTHLKTAFPTDLKKTEYNRYQFQINKTNYLVDEGCGPVVVFKDSTFTRIDRSFKHKNQYGGIPFTHDNKIHVWGGYGLFTFKNIITSYSRTLKEWSFIDAKNSNLIKPRYEAFSLKIGDKLYVFGGNNNPTSNVIDVVPIVDDTLYTLDLATMTWQKGNPISLSEHATEWERDLRKSYAFQVGDKLYILNLTNNLTEINIFENTIKTFYNTDFKTIRSIIYHPKTKQVSYVYNTAGNENKITTQSFKDFKGNLIKSSPFYKQKKDKYYTIYAVAIIFVLLVLYLVIRHFKSYKKPKQKLVFESSKQRFKFKTKVLTLSSTETNILKIFAANGNTFTPLTALNDIVSLDFDSNTHTTLLKRRELILKDLVVELATILKIPKKELIIERRNEQDKRIKEIKFKFDIVIK